ncbi:PKD domain-containing protein [Sanguibacter antarcticus]|nr:PKD domain-containing protein [Sanguibacter antarcticus]
MGSLSLGPLGPLHLLATDTPSPPSPGRTFGAATSGDGFNVNGSFEDFTIQLSGRKTQKETVHIAPESLTCGGPGVFASACATVGANEAAARCDDPTDFEFAPTTISTLDELGNWTAPVHNSFIACATTPAGAPPVVFTEADFQALAITPSAIVVGPSGGWLPVQMDNVAYTDATPQTLVTTIVGQAVTVRATPTQFTWNWADDSAPTTTTDPGRAWPNHTVAHPYTRAGDYTVTMTTRWTGELSLDGGSTYQPITGTATTTSTAPSITVTELRSRLVDDLVY